MQQISKNTDLLSECKKAIIDFPLKSKMYVNMLISIEDTHNNIQVPKEIKKKYQSFLCVFRRLNSEQRRFFIKQTIQFIESFLINRNNQYEPDIKQIQTSCEIKTKFLKVSYWDKKNFKYQYNNLSIKLSGNKKVQTLNLKNYLVRKSKSQSRSLALESYDSSAPQSLQKITIKFANNSLFEAIYSNIRDTIINISNKRIQILLKQQKQSNIQSRFAQNNLQNGLTFLDHKTINEYFGKKQGQLQKLKKYKQNLLCIHNQNHFNIYNSSKKASCYYIQYIFPQKNVNQSGQIYQKILKIPILNNGSLLDTFTNNVSSQYYKWIISNNQYQSIMISQKIYRPKHIQQIMKSINSIFQLINIEFINLIISFNDTKNQYKLDMQMIVKFTAKCKQNKTKFIIKLIQNMINRSLFQVKFQPNLSFQSSYQRSTIDINSTHMQSKLNLTQFKPKYTNLDLDQDSITLDQIEYQNKPNNIKFSQKQTSINQAESFSSPQEDQIFYTIQDIQDQNQIFQHQVIQSSRGDNQSNVFKKNIKISNNNDQKVEQINSKNMSYLIHRYQQKPLINYPQKYIEAHYLKTDWRRSQKGGVICIDEKAISQQKKVFKHIFNQLLKMQNPTNFSLPIQICRDQSALVSIARNLSFAPKLFQNCDKLTPLERIKKVVIFQISMASLALSCKKPLNPIIGQTYQGIIDGCPVYMQQISHHPPITSLYFIGRGYKVYGTIGIQLKLRLNYVKGVNYKTLTIQFDNKQKIQFSLPTMLINGMIFGERSIYFQGKNFIIDFTNNMIAETKFNSTDNIKLKDKQKSPDYLDGHVYKIESSYIEENLKGTHKNLPKLSQKNSLSSYYGQWNGQLYMDQQKVFDFQQNYPFLMENTQFRLQSDSTFRKDVLAMKQDNIQKAQDQKVLLEQNQRADKKLRQNTPKVITKIY